MTAPISSMTKQYSYLLDQAIGLMPKIYIFNLIGFCITGDFTYEMIDSSYQIDDQTVLLSARSGDGSNAHNVATPSLI